MEVSLNFNENTTTYLIKTAKEDDITYVQVIINAIRIYQLWREGYLTWNHDKVSKKLLNDK